MCTAIVSVLMSATIGCIAYFYKEWKGMIISYKRLLPTALWITENNLLLLQLMADKEINAFKHHGKLKLIPPYYLSRLGNLDDYVRDRISFHNQEITKIMSFTTITDANLKVALVKVHSARNAITSMRQFIDDTLGKHPFLFYMLTFMLNNRVNKLDALIRQ